MIDKLDKYFRDNLERKLWRQSMNHDGPIILFNHIMPHIIPSQLKILNIQVNHIKVDKK